VRLDELGPFESVLDVGGNVGGFAEEVRGLWPAARVTSFEPVPQLARANRERARGRWFVHEVAVSDEAGRATISVCTNQHTASTMQPPGSSRRIRFGIRDTFESVEVATRPLDDYLGALVGRCLLKIDVEGHELHVLAGASHALDQVAAVVCEVNEDPDVFLDSPPASVVDDELRRHGLFFAGVRGALLDGRGEVVQFDGVWRR
jgi:FkbM family methyltransferase